MMTNICAVRLSRRRTLQFLAIAPLALVFVGGLRNAAAQGQPAFVGASHVTTSDVHWTWDPVTVLGSSRLVRTEAGITASLQSSGLPPGHAVTMWFVVFNYPEFCASSPCGPADIPNPDVKFDGLYGAGHVIGGSGSANFGGHLPVGDASGSFAVEQGGAGVGLLNPLGAEVFLMLHVHGPAGTGQLLKSQISSFFGGCQVFLGPDGVADGPEDMPVSTGECSTVQLSIHQ
jgi:hypothetical protein